MDEARAFFAWLAAHDATHLAEAAGPLRRARSNRRARVRTVRTGKATLARNRSASATALPSNCNSTPTVACSPPRSTTCAAAAKIQADEAKLLAGFGRSVLKLWTRPDNGIWEIRGGCRDYTLSKVWCWVALDCLLQLQQRGVINVDTARIRAGREAIAHIIESRGFNAQLSELRADPRWRSSRCESAAHGVPGLQGPERRPHARHL